MIFALSGNPNCGKTTLYNVLTGSNRRVGNFAGVTVDVKSGKSKKYGFTVVDLPGIYSLFPYSAEEKLAGDYLLNSRPDGIIDVVDATNPERNLYLTLQLLELGIPVIVALNMIDEAEKNGVSVNAEKLSSLLGVPVVPVSALKKTGIKELVSVAKKTVEKHAAENLSLGRIIPGEKIYPGDLIYPKNSFVSAVCDVVKENANKNGLSPTYVATSIISGENPIILTDAEKIETEKIIKNAENSAKTDRYALLVDIRYSQIENFVGQTFTKGKSLAKSRSDRIDRVLTNEYATIPIFIAVMLAVFLLSFELIGKFFGDLLQLGIDELETVCVSAMETHGASKVLVSLVKNSVFSGVGSVLAFLPYILTLFFFLSLVEDTGYMARIAFVSDKLLTKIGLSGRSIVPMLIGFGCTVPAVMSTRTVPSDRERKMTIMLLPFMSCSAKLPVYALFCASCLTKYKGLVTFSLYLIGILCGVIFALFLKSTKFKGEPVPFVMELPNYRFPSPKNVVRLMWDKAKDYVGKTFGAIFIASVSIWAMRSFDPSFTFTENAEESVLFYLCDFLSPLFRPLGLGDWRIVASLVAGFTAKEAVVGTMGILYPDGISSAFTLASAYSFLLFVLLYTPCAAAISAIGKELRSPLKAALIAANQCLTAYAVAFVFYSAITLIGGL